MSAARQHSLGIWSDTARRMGVRVLESGHQQRIEDLAMQITILTVHSPFGVQAEITRREGLFRQASLASPRPTEHPRIAALESVLNDARNGRFG